MLQFVQVSALALDPSGARLITGGHDYDVKLFDFAGMDSTLKPFRTLRPCEWWVRSQTIRKGILLRSGDTHKKVDVEKTYLFLLPTSLVVPDNTFPMSTDKFQGLNKLLTDRGHSY